jgi:hypothetical protein
MKSVKKEKTRKSQTRREKSEYPYLDPALNLKTRFEEIEDLASYADSLPEDAKKWLNEFSKNYICASIDKTHDDAKEVYSRNNARNRCIYTQEKAQGCLNYLEDLVEDGDNDDVED